MSSLSVTSEKFEKKIFVDVSFYLHVIRSSYAKVGPLKVADDKIGKALYSSGSTCAVVLDKSVFLNGFSLLLVFAMFGIYSGMFYGVSIFGIYVNSSADFFRTTAVVPCEPTTVTM